jgi:hypothetical protein
MSRVEVSRQLTVHRLRLQLLPETSRKIPVQQYGMFYAMLAVKFYQSAN